MRSTRLLSLQGTLLCSAFSLTAPHSIAAETPPPTASVTQNAPRWQATPEDQAKVREAWRRINAWYADGGVKNSRKLFVTYFMPTDRPAHPQHRERMDRIVRNVRDFYAREMVSNGLPPLTFGIETDDKGLLKLHECHGDKPLSGYDKNGNIGNGGAGEDSHKASEKALKSAGIDINKNHTLIICQMPDGFSPYYGGGVPAAGRCWICDLSGLDSVNLASRLSKAETLKLATNDEERANFRGRDLGDHTTVYVGGTAHELGHAFNLPHTGASPEQSAQWGTSLMGSGNYTYGEELRGGGKGSFLVPTDAMRLISQPLFSGYDKQVDTNGAAEFSALAAKPEGNAIRITGRIAKSAVPVYAVIVSYNLDQPAGDYQSNAVSALVDEKNGEFTALISRNHNGPVDLELTALHLNGDRTELHTPSISHGFALDTGRLNLAWTFAEPKRLFSAGKTGKALAAVRAIAANPAGDAISQRAAAWERALARPKPGAAPTARPESEASVSLTACAAMSEKTGYPGARPSRDFVPPPHGPVPEIDGKPFPHTLFTHAPGGFTYDLGGSWKKLTGSYGVQQGVPPGSVALIIVGDGKILFEGPVVGPPDSSSARQGRSPTDADRRRSSGFSIDITGVKTLELRVTDGGNGNGSDWAVIGDPVLTR